MCFQSGSDVYSIRIIHLNNAPTWDGLRVAVRLTCGEFTLKNRSIYGLRQNFDGLTVCVCAFTSVFNFIPQIYTCTFLSLNVHGNKLDGVRQSPRGGGVSQPAAKKTEHICPNNGDWIASDASALMHRTFPLQGPSTFDEVLLEWKIQFFFSNQFLDPDKTSNKFYSEPEDNTQNAYMRRQQIDCVYANKTSSIWSLLAV